MRGLALFQAVACAVTFLLRVSVRTSREGFLDGVHMHLHVDLDDSNCVLDPDDVRSNNDADGSWKLQVQPSFAALHHRGIDVLDAHSKPDEATWTEQIEECGDCTIYNPCLFNL